MSTQTFRTEMSQSLKCFKIIQFKSLISELSPVCIGQSVLSAQSLMTLRSLLLLNLRYYVSLSSQGAPGLGYSWASELLYSPSFQ